MYRCVQESFPGRGRTRRPVHSRRLLEPWLTGVRVTSSCVSGCWATGGHGKFWSWGSTDVWKWTLGHRWVRLPWTPLVSERGMLLHVRDSVSWWIPSASPSSSGATRLAAKLHARPNQSVSSWAATLAPMDFTGRPAPETTDRGGRGIRSLKPCVCVCVCVFLLSL